MHRRSVLRTALFIVPLFLAAHAAMALEPLDAFPPTTFTVALLARPPNGFAFSKLLRGIVPGHPECAVNQTYSFNYTPAYPACFEGTFIDGNPIPLPVTWNVAAALGVRINGGTWSSTACMLGDISSQGANSAPSCVPGFQGNAGPGLLFGVADTPPLRTFQISTGTDTVELGAALDNAGIVVNSVTGMQQAVIAALGDGIQGFGGLDQVGNTAIVTLSGASQEVVDAVTAVAGPVGTFISVIGSIISVIADFSPEHSVMARQDCLAGLLGNPANGSMHPQDTVGTMVTGKQLYRGTQTGSLFVSIPARMDFVPKDPPWGFGACQAATDVTFEFDRPINPGTNSWSDGLAFQPRSPDSAIVRRRNAVESFRADPARHRIEHVSWRYAPFEDRLDTTDGLAACNGPQSCSSRAWVEPVGGYIASAADPLAQHPPTISNPAIPFAALSPDPGQLVLFYADDTGSLYISAATYGANDVPAWRTWLLTMGLPPNAPVSAVRTYGNSFDYQVFWVGMDGAVRSLAITNSDTQPGSSVTSSAISDQIATPGAAIAAIERSPRRYEVFVTGRSGVSLLTNQDMGDRWTASLISPTQGQVASDSPLSVVATSVNNLDVFFLDPSHALQHASLTSQLPTTWSVDSRLPHVVTSAGKPQLSAVSRAPNIIDVTMPCDTGGLCDVSIEIAGATTLPGPTPAISTATFSVPGWTLSGPLSIVAAFSTALDIIAVSDGNAFDTSWQVGAGSWSTTVPVGTCDGNGCASFSMSVSPTSFTLDAGDSISLHLSTMMLNDTRPISLSYAAPDGIVPGIFNPTSVMPGQGVDIGFSSPFGTPGGPKAPIMITGQNGIETHTVNVGVTVIATTCVPLTCGAGQCGSMDNGCGGTLMCGGCADRQQCVLGMCVPARCRPRTCPRGSHWDVTECACVGD
jgi:hypothetical protein